mmetsp:Transcript_2022/g.2821  ORF Transcript_2022/g.2821 Transcript_2022/m.2821 type:complete len:308 (-) Transcript_2022:263-1186(-)|eukprot:CAMPEP_0198151708 /NCGR_PEP_ID=MMETSP1443-20131203/56728_1 /TAXON_ID=186043 /ORGANISM="Entomoneis sp., Strain CCMP2396" /LENGTH=307 /DNA_ID=CAMNT_0043817475 /DNA_START=92 /DNA_END=1015 /DNA_ORIENTATION=+
MCLATSSNASKVRKDSSSSVNEPEYAEKSTMPTSLLRLVWPISPLAMACLLPLIPSHLYVNAGYTKWFHIMSFCYLMTQNAWLSKFVALMGTTVTLGWWASIMYDLYKNGRFGHILLWNMPSSMTAVMLDENNQVRYNTNERLAVILLSHLLDTLAHPALALYFWKLNQFKVSNVLTWSIVISTYCLSRTWSMFHNYHNDGAFKLHYIGHDVYKIYDDNAENLPGMWIPAYVMEGACYVVIVMFKLFWEKKNNRRASVASKAPTSPPPHPVVLEQMSTSMSSSFLSEGSLEEIQRSGVLAQKDPAES